MHQQQIPTRRGPQRYKLAYRRHEREDTQDDLAAHLIQYLRYLFESVKLQQEIRDRWFLYYLSVAGAVLGVALSAGKAYFESSIHVDALCLLLLFICLFMGAIGLCFFMIYLRQRANYLSLYRRIEPAQHQLLELLANHGSLENGTNFLKAHTGVPIQTIRPFGADFFTVWIHIIVNSLYFSAAYLFMNLFFNGVQQLTNLQTLLTFAFFTLVLIQHEMLRRRNFV